MAKTKVLICPYCGDAQGAGERCKRCGGLFEALSRQATHNAMGPWFVRDEVRPFQPGASYETIIRLIERKLVTKYSIIRGPTTKQFWTVAKRVPGIAHLLGYCHNCDASVDPGDHGCHSCGVPFGAYMDRNFLGLPDIRPLPWEASAEEQAPTSPNRMDFRRAAEPLGISSFASDDELRGAGMSPMSSFGYTQTQTATLPLEGTRPMGAQSSGINASSMQIESAPVAESTEAILAARALQRRLKDQQKTIRILVIGMCVLATVLVIGLATMIARGPSAVEAQDKQPTPTKQNAQATPATSPAAEDESISELPDPALDSPMVAPEPEVIEPQPSQPANDGRPDNDLAADPDYAAAQQLIAAAENAERPRSERIADYENALQLLKRSQQRASAEQQIEISELIKRIEHEIERLRLEEFFP